MAERSVLLRLEGLRKSFGKQIILQGISLDVYQGEFLTLLGPSGCGKTTTLRGIGGFEPLDEGKILLEGKDVTSLPPYRRDVHTVFQHYALFPHYDVFENVAFGLRIRRTPQAELEARVKEALALVQLAGYERRKPDQLSGGQKQRIALARALVCRPKVLLLDEPLGALDFKLRKTMQLELKALQKRLGISFIYVTHDQEEAMTMSDRIAVMNKGLIEQLGSPKEIYDRPTTAFVADFIGAANLLDAKLLRYEGETAEVLLEGSLKVAVRAPAGPRAKEGDSVQIAVRPERVQVVSAGQSAGEGRFLLPCELKETVFLGSASQFVLTPAGSAKTLIATAMRGGSSNGHKSGRVMAELRPDDLILLR